jgi:hypothetical protein
MGKEARQTKLSGNVKDFHISAQYDLVTLIPSRYPGVRRMTARTVICRRNVIGRFAGSNYPVMTAHASPGHTAVVETCRYPGDCNMAVVTLVRAWNMIHGFARRLYAIVTRYAGAGNDGMVHAGAGPIEFGMAVVAGGDGSDVIGTLLGQRYGGRITMTTLATDWRAFEDRVHVAYLAAHPGVRAIEQKTGGVMIERLGRQDGLRAEDHGHEQQQ